MPWAAVLLLTFLGGCGSTSAQRTAESLASWTETAAVVIEAWSAGAVPTTYTRQTLERAGEELAQSEQRLDALSGADGERLRPMVRDLRQATTDARRAVAAADRARAREVREQLALRAAALRAEAERLRRRT